MDTATLQTSIDKLGTDFAEFKRKNDERLDAVTSGVPKAELEQIVDRINAEIMANQTAIAAEVDLRKAAEKVANRIGSDLNQRDYTKSKELVLASADLVSFIRKNDDLTVDDLVESDFDQLSDYSKALDVFMRKGPAGIDNDVRNEISVGSDPRGGYWVDPAMSSRLVELIYETSPMRSVAFIETISTDALEGDYDLDEASLGGWVNEVSTRTGNTATPDLGGWRIPVHEQYAEPRSTQQALDDARRDVAAWLIAKVTNKFARVENTAFVNGDGDGKPRGFLQHTSGVPSAATFDVVEQVASGSATLLLTGGIIDLVYRLKSAWRNGAQFAANNLTIAAIRKLVDGDGNYIWQPDYSLERGQSLLGHPIVEMADMPDVGAGAEALAFANFLEAYTIVDRAGVTVLRDPYTTKGKVKFYMTTRVGGDVVNFDAIKLQTIST